jgi:hypothetical protein
MTEGNRFFFSLIFISKGTSNITLTEALFQEGKYTRSSSAQQWSF